jgi:hypothetical protein
MRPLPDASPQIPIQRFPAHPQIPSHLGFRFAGRDSRTQIGQLFIVDLAPASACSRSVWLWSLQRYWFRLETCHGGYGMSRCSRAANALLKADFHSLHPARAEYYNDLCGSGWKGERGPRSKKRLGINPTAVRIDRHGKRLQQTQASIY